ncbi:hypothetical protein FA13DRAFT_332881 [Coprinellus micaceus]|uniref:Uncharacterized protein n=1 Tax=Coprinellus micaceus TaxID=71717 RepID=A0A4Y7TDC3_COPMI|nr:hypothetical protein FA13DRAFT_332881 [Coprinellus micaceus]
MATSSSMSSNDPTHIRSDTENVKEDEVPLPAPTTTRNRIPRSRATSLARSRGSSRASSASRSCNGSRAVSRAGSGAGNLSRPGSRAGHASSIDGVSGDGSWTGAGLVWQPGVDMDSLDDELGYVGVGSSGAGAGPSGSTRYAVEGAPAPMSGKAKGKKRARSTPEGRRRRMCEVQGEGGVTTTRTVAASIPRRP